MNEQAQANWDSQNIPEEFRSQLNALSGEVDRLKSNNILSRIKRWIFIESILFLVLFYLILEADMGGSFSGLWIAGVVVAAGVNAYYYAHFLKKANAAALSDTRTSLKTMIDLLRALIKRIKWLNIFAIPFVFSIMILNNINYQDGLTLADVPMEFFLVLLAIVLVITGVSIFLLFKSYLPSTFQKWLKEYEVIYSDLTS